MVRPRPAAFALRNVLTATVALAALAACDPYAPTLNPDYAIRVAPDPARPGHSVAIAPLCPSYGSAIADPYDDQPMPQYGCANAQNLAAMVDNPNDLIAGRRLGDTRGVTAVGSVRRYDAGQTRGLIVPGSEVNSVATTTSSNGASSLSGDVTNGGGSSGGAAGGGGGGSAPASP